MMQSAAPFIKGCRDGELRFQHCDSCGAAQTLVRYACHACASRRLSWRNSNGVGTVYALTRVARAPSEIYRPLVPYVLVLVELDEGFRLMGHATAGVAIGDRVRAAFFKHADLTLVRFEQVAP